MRFNTPSVRRTNERASEIQAVADGLVRLMNDLHQVGGGGSYFFCVCKIYS
jgi:hypothetical protein